MTNNVSCSFHKLDLAFKTTMCSQTLYKVIIYHHIQSIFDFNKVLMVAQGKELELLCT